MILTAVSPSIEGLTVYFAYLEERHELEEKDWEAEVKKRFNAHVLEATAMASGESVAEYVKRIADADKAEALAKHDKEHGVKDEKSEREKMVDYYREKQQSLQEMIEANLKRQ